MTPTTTSPDTRHEPTDPRAERTVHAAEQIVDAAVDVGRSWAAYGLRIGKLALETHAHTMGRVADALGALQHAIDDRADAPTGAPATPEARAHDAARDPAPPAADASAPA